ERLVGLRHDHPWTAQNCHQCDVARQVEPLDRLSAPRRVVGQCDLDQVGVATATSTPQFSSNSHSLRGSLTRATTRGTANSVLASRLTTTFTLSSPVAAITTSNSSSFTDSNRLSSH